MQSEDIAQRASKSSSDVKSRSHRSARPAKTPSSAPLLSDKLLKIHPTTLLCQKINVTGSHPITIGANAIIQPFATLDSSAGPIDIGEGCIVWECATVGSSELNSGATTATLTTIIGNNSVIESQSSIDAGAEVKQGCVISVAAKVGTQACIGEVGLHYQRSLPGQLVLKL